MALFPPIEQPAEQVRELLAPLRNDVSIAIYNHQNAFSIGGIIRVAHSFLVSEIIIIGRERYYEKASMGMHRYENISVVDSDNEFLQHVGDRPLWSIEKDTATVSLFAVPEYPRNVVLVFGSERAGLPDSIIKASSAVVGIPMYGINHSYPVSVTVGMVLCDWARRRYAPGTIVVPSKTP